MNREEVSEIGWTGRRWALWLAVVMALQVAVIFWLSDFRVSPQKARAPTIRVHFAPQKASERLSVFKPERTDPTLFALVHPEGFSRRAWLSVPPFQYQATNQPEPLHWLALPTEELADDFAEYVQTNSVVDEVIPEQFPPALAHPSLPSPVIIPGMVIKLEGDLAGSQVILPSSMPRPTTPILANSIVRVLVDAAGWPLSAALLATSGVVRADQDALGVVKAARFANAPRTNAAAVTNSSGLRFGNVVFQWAKIRWDQLPAAPTPPRNHE